VVDAFADVPFRGAVDLFVTVDVPPEEALVRPAAFFWACRGL
jgi:hypothetical protein